jgi:hypothetical protein
MVHMILRFDLVYMILKHYFKTLNLAFLEFLISLYPDILKRLLDLIYSYIRQIQLLLL